ncbi:MAG: ZIP family metal transporter, partial [Solirubrobacterales bacterium]
VALAVALVAIFGIPGLGDDREVPPAEELAVERTVLRPGEVELTVRNDGADAVDIAQVIVNGVYVDFAGGGEVGRLASETLTLNYPWIEGQPVAVTMVLSTGGTIAHEVPVAVETPQADAGFFGLMGLLGIYVGVIPVALGMLWLPFVRRVPARWMQLIMALTVGLLGFLAIDGLLEGLELGGEGPTAFGGVELVLLGAFASFLALSAVQAHLEGKRDEAERRGVGGHRVALLVAVGIGLHNLGEGLAIGVAFSSGALALGAFLVIGFALHNTTEGLAIVAPLADEGVSLGRLVALGLVAGAPAILGAWIGAAAFHPSLAALLFGVGVGAIAQVITQLAPAMRDRLGRLLHPISVAGILGGALVLYATGLLISV